MLSHSEIFERLQPLIVPQLEQSLGALKAIQHIHQEGNTITLRVMLPLPPKRLLHELTEKIQSALPEIPSVRVTGVANIQRHAIKNGVSAHPDIKNVIAVASGKGGVGKSTTAVNLAIALQQQGARVGLLDADIHGPNQPILLGQAKTRIAADADKRLPPVMAYGLQTMSMGYLLDPNTPMVWRGPMVSSALEQLVSYTRWDNLDYLIVDLPPGTGDVQLTLAKKIPVTTALIVTTPQAIALADVRKAIAMFNKVQVPVAGIVENMSEYICPCCGERTALFGTGGAEQLNAQFQLPVLARLPLVPEVQALSDSGTPITVQTPMHAMAEAYQQLALTVGVHLALQPIDYRVKFPSVVVEPKSNAATDS